jgi:signal peptidase I
MFAKLARWIGLGVGVCCVALIVAAAGVLVVAPRLVHGTALTVLTGSMTPTLQVGSVVIDRPVDPGTLHVGDIATYQKAPGVAEYITHRIVAINAHTDPVSFTFKGDANRGPDPTPVPATAIRGKVWFDVPYLGSIRDSIQGGGLRAWLLIAVIAGLVGYAGKQVRDAMRQRRRAGRLTADMDRLELRFRSASFAGIDPAGLAGVLGGELSAPQDADGEPTLTMTFQADANDLAIIERLLETFDPLDRTVPSGVPGG